MSRGCAWLVGVLILEGEEVDVGLGKRTLEGAAETKVLDWELMAFLD